MGVAFLTVFQPCAAQVTLNQIRRDPVPAPAPQYSPAPTYGRPLPTNYDVLPAGTRLYLIVDEKVTSAHSDGGVGAIVRCRVWRDVEYQGVLFIKGDSPATCRIDRVSHATIGGFKGKISIGGIDARSVDGQSVTLDGGYNKEGTGEAALVWSIGLLLFWPALFASGGNAVIPPGTVFDVSTVNDLRVAMSPTVAAGGPPKSIDLRGMGDILSADFMLDDFVAQPKHAVMRIKVSKDGALPANLVVDSVNGAPVEPVRVELRNVVVTDGLASGVAEVQTAALAKHFVRGINRFDLAYDEGGAHKATEVILNVQM